MDYGCILLVTREDLATMRIERIGGIILKVEQEVRRNSQWLEAIYWLVWIISEGESKFKGPWIQQDEFSKWTVFVQRRVGLDTKEKQLEALQIVREGTTVQHKELIAEDERIDKKLKQIIKASGRNVSNYFAGGVEKSHKYSGRKEMNGKEK